jgi:hypothetical protein
VGAPGSDIRDAQIKHNGIKYYLAGVGEYLGSSVSIAAPLTTYEDPDRGVLIGFTVSMGDNLSVTCVGSNCENLGGCSPVFDSAGNPVDCSLCKGGNCNKTLVTLKSYGRMWLEFFIELIKTIGAFGSATTK